MMKVFFLYLIKRKKSLTNQDYRYFVKPSFFEAVSRCVFICTHCSGLTALSVWTASFVIS